ncbi:MAG: Holliday junction branch migration protein RuvA [Pseudomonadota bacterium]
MIGHLEGQVHSVGTDTAILSVNGVGYEVSATPRLLGRLTPGQTASLSIETLVAETFIRLVGFDSETERRTFRLLQSVQGVGAKAALAILHVLTPSQLMDAVASGDKAAVARAQGVGPKLAGRVVTELKGKTVSLLGADDFRPPSTPEGGSDSVISNPTAQSVRQDAISALLNLGYDDAAAHRALQSIPNAPDETVETLLTAALKGIGGQSG